MKWFFLVCTLLGFIATTTLTDQWLIMLGAFGLLALAIRSSFWGENGPRRQAELFDHLDALCTASGLCRDDSAHGFVWKGRHAGYNVQVFLNRSFITVDAWYPLPKGGANRDFTIKVRWSGHKSTYGDPAFDEIAGIEDGILDSEMLAAVLGAPARAHLTDFFHDDAGQSDYWVLVRAGKITVFTDHIEDSDALLGHLERITQTAEILDLAGHTLSEVLHRNVVTEPIPSILDLLILACADTPKGRSAATAALESRRTAVRVKAALTIGPGALRELAAALPLLTDADIERYAFIDEAVKTALEGLPLHQADDLARELMNQGKPTLLRLMAARHSGPPLHEMAYAVLSAVTPGEYDYSVIAEAVNPMVEWIVDDEKPTQIRALVQNSHAPRLRADILAALGRINAPWIQGYLCSFLTDDDAVSLSAIAALGAQSEWTDPQVEPAIIAALDGADQATTIGLINALGLVGTAAVVPALRTYCDELFDDLLPKRAALKAIDAIQNRVHDGDRGQLSLTAADTVEGGLSNTEG